MYRLIILMFTFYVIVNADELGQLNGEVQVGESVTPADLMHEDSDASIYLQQKLAGLQKDTIFQTIGLDPIYRDEIAFNVDVQIFFTVTVKVKLNNFVANGLKYSNIEIISVHKTYEDDSLRIDVTALIPNLEVKFHFLATYPGFISQNEISGRAKVFLEDVQLQIAAVVRPVTSGSRKVYQVTGLDMKMNVDNIRVTISNPDDLPVSPSEILSHAKKKVFKMIAQEVMTEINKQLEKVDTNITKNNRPSDKRSMDLGQLNGKAHVGTNVPPAYSLHKDNDASQYLQGKLNKLTKGYIVQTIGLDPISKAKINMVMGHVFVSASIKLTKFIATGFKYMNFDNASVYKIYEDDSLRIDLTASSPILATKFRFSSTNKILLSTNEVSGHASVFLEHVRVQIAAVVCPKPHRDGSRTVYRVAGLDMKNDVENVRVIISTSDNLPMTPSEMVHSAKQELFQMVAQAVVTEINVLLERVNMDQVLEHFV